MYSFFNESEIRGIVGLSEETIEATLETTSTFEDFYVLDGFLYNMESYDLEGKEIVYASVDANKKFTVHTENRYRSNDGLHISFGEMDTTRNDIVYITAQERR